MNIFRNARQNLLRRQAEAGQADLERQEPRDHEAVRPSQQEMQQQQDRPQTATRSFRRGADTQRLSSATAGPRPTSSHYTTSSNYPDDEILSPKTPQFAHGIPPVLSEQLNLHELQNELQNDLRRLSSRGSSGPQSPAGSNTARPSAEVSEPVPAMTARHMLGRSRSSSSNSSSGSRRDRRRRRFAGADPAEMHLASMAEDGRRRQQMANGPPPAYPGSTTTEPKHSFFCLPYIRSRRTRAQIVRSIVSGVILASTIAVVLALYLTNNVYNMEFLVLLLLMVLVASLFFFHGLVRLCLMILHPMTPVEEAAAEEQSRRRHAGDPLMPNIYAVGGYAIPDQPIRVVLARDEEAAGIESDAAKLQPPAYGLWRESVVSFLFLFSSFRFFFICVSQSSSPSPPLVTLYILGSKLTISQSVLTQTASTGSATRMRSPKATGHGQGAPAVTTAAGTGPVEAARARAAIRQEASPAETAATATARSAATARARLRTCPKTVSDMLSRHSRGRSHQRPSPHCLHIHPR